jgi:hypothetical protein
VRWFTGSELERVDAVDAARKWRRFAEYADVDTPCCSASRTASPYSSPGRARILACPRSTRRWEAFLELAAGRRANPCPADESIPALQIALACDGSLASGEPVAVEEVI